ncbi:MAG TPA: BCAM0308 family protein [Myxococcota bacterium]|nr:BCAM0308 family protein [Myxococcota bacterium]
MKGKGKGPKSRKASERAERPQPSRHEPERGKTDRPAGKLAEPQVCSTCKAIYHEGRWVWPKVANPTGRPTLCPACQRIRDELPGGEVRISGDFAREHKDEILARVRHVEEREKAEHPLQRLMAIREVAHETLITTTDSHLAHAIGTALHDAFKGELSAPWAEKNETLRVRWSR